MSSVRTFRRSTRFIYVFAFTLAFSALASSVLLGGCSNLKKAEHDESAPPETSSGPQTGVAWPVKMHRLSQTFSSLLPLVSSKAKFNDEKNQARIEEDTRQLRALAHSLSKDGAPNADPSLRVLSGLFQEDIDRALESLKSGNREYARGILKDTSSYCIQCHTQSNNGPEFPKLNLDINLSELNPLEQAEFFAATRQFDRALASYEKVLSSRSLAKEAPFEWEQAARSALAIVVRVKNDPKAAAELLNTVERNAGLPPSTKKIAAAWRKSIKEWATEKQKAPLTSQEKISRASDLIKRAQNRQEFPLDHSQDIFYFRSSSLLHEVLGEHAAKDDVTAQALYWAGVSAEATRDMNFWTLHETLYEACVRTVPQSELAKKCYARLKDSITLGYSGSGGVRIPPEINRRLEAIAREAGVTKASAEKSK